MKKTIYLFAFIFTVLSFAAAPEKASAQYNYNYSSNIWVNSNMNLLFQKRWETARIRAAGKTQLADAMEGRRSAGNGNQTTTQQQQSAPAENILRRAPLSETSFKSNPATIMPAILGASVTGGKAEDSRTLIKVSRELLKNYDEMLATNQETRLKNNVAGAAAFALVMSRSVLLDGQRDLSEKQSEALLQDINALLASSDDFKKMPDADRQKMYETFVITGGLAAMLYREGTEKNDAETIAKGKELAKAVLSQFFRRSLNEINFTEEGVQFGF
ncbi:MAG: hypothetical protein M3384_08970 [Acidobacteriota bacterium]|nr:hypothetical protein [Acidobacteriota bacterium]